MIDFDYYKIITKEYIQEHNPNLPKIFDHPCRTSIVEVLNLEIQVLCFI